MLASHTRGHRRLKRHKFSRQKTGGMGESNLLPKEGATYKAVLTAASESVRENIVKNDPFIIMIIINTEKNHLFYR